MKNTKTELRPLHNDILFVFEDSSTTIVDGKIKQTAFLEKTSWGLVYKSPTISASSPRWGVVIAVGPTVDEDIFVGRRILIEALKWTNVIRFNGEEFWKTNDEQVLAVDSTQD